MNDALTVQTDDAEHLNTSDRIVILSSTNINIFY